MGKTGLPVQNTKKDVRVGRKLLILLFWILLWQGCALLVKNDILLPSPLRVLQSLWENVQTYAYWQRCVGSVFRILLGFGAGTLIGFGLSLLFERFTLLRDLFSPILYLFKTIPVACVAVLILIFANAKWLVFWITFSVVTPQIVMVMESGLRNVPAPMREMGKMYHFSYLETLCFIKRPSYAEGLKQGLKLSLETSFKAGISAEIIGLPLKSIGEGIYLKKIYYDTAGVLGYVLTILLLAFICRVLLGCVTYLTEKRAYGYHLVSRKRRIKENYGFLCLDGITVCYGERVVLAEKSMDCKQGSRYLITAPSGKGKTTLLKVLAGMHKVREGTCKNAIPVTMLFQEDRLVEKADALTNVLLGMRERNRGEALAALKRIGIEESDCTGKLVQEFSGGMKRKVAVARALLSAPANGLILLDEPFASVDKDSEEKIFSEILAGIEGKTCVLVSHTRDSAVTFTRIDL